MPNEWVLLEEVAGHCATAGKADADSPVVRPLLTFLPQQAAAVANRNPAESPGVYHGVSTSQVLDPLDR